MLEQTGLRDRADEQLGRLSGGNRQRVNIAIGLLARPGRRAARRARRRRLTRASASGCGEFIAPARTAGTGVLFTTHDIAEAERYAARVLVLADGELLFSGPPGRAARATAAATSRARSCGFLRERGH